MCEVVENNKKMRIECQGIELWVKPFAKGLREREGRALASRRKSDVATVP